MKYQAKITVEYNFVIEDTVGLTQKDVEGYKKYSDSLYDGKEIENVKDLVQVELEEAILCAKPTVAPILSNAFSVDSEISDINVEIECIAEK